MYKICHAEEVDYPHALPFLVKLAILCPVSDTSHNEITISVQNALKSLTFVHDLLNIPPQMACNMTGMAPFDTSNCF